MAIRCVCFFFKFWGGFFVALQGQTCFDVADPDVLRLLEECKKRQAIILRDRPETWNNRTGGSAGGGGLGVGGVGGPKTSNSQKRRLKEAAILP